MNSFTFASFTKTKVPLFGTRDKCTVPEEVVLRDLTIESEDYVTL
jgi:hypothetical protein